MGKNKQDCFFSVLFSNHRAPLSAPRERPVPQPALPPPESRPLPANAYSSYKASSVTSSMKPSSGCLGPGHFSHATMTPRSHWGPKVCARPPPPQCTGSSTREKPRPALLCAPGAVGGSQLCTPRSGPCAMWSPARSDLPEAGTPPRPGLLRGRRAFRMTHKQTRA